MQACDQMGHSNVGPPLPGHLSDLGTAWSFSRSFRKNESKIFVFIFFWNWLWDRRNSKFFIFEKSLKGQFCYKNILLFDVPESDLLQHWEDTYKFILNAAKSNGKVLIHCKMGISRSASTVCAFLMKYKSWGLKHALRFVKGMTHFVWLSMRNK